MSHNFNSTTDLQPLLSNAMTDGQWHCVPELLQAIGDKIMYERAVRFYQGQGGGAAAAAKQGGDTRSLEERVRAGRRRGLYLCVGAMLSRKTIECKDPIVEFDKREYRMVSPPPERKRPAEKPKAEKPKAEKPKAEKPKVESPKSVSKESSSAKAFLSFVEAMETMFLDAFPYSRDHGDLRFHCRAIKRIAQVNFMESQKSTPPDAEKTPPIVAVPAPAVAASTKE